MPHIRYFKTHFSWNLFVSLFWSSCLNFSIIIISFLTFLKIIFQQWSLSHFFFKLERHCSPGRAHHQLNLKTPPPPPPKPSHYMRCTTVSTRYDDCQLHSSHTHTQPGSFMTWFRWWHLFPNSLTPLQQWKSCPFSTLACQFRACSTRNDKRNTRKKNIKLIEVENAESV